MPPGNHQSREHVSLSLEERKWGSYMAGSLTLKAGDREVLANKIKQNFAFAADQFDHFNTELIRRGELPQLPRSPSIVHAHASALAFVSKVRLCSGNPRRRTRTRQNRPRFSNVDIRPPVSGQPASRIGGARTHRPKFVPNCGGVCCRGPTISRKPLIYLVGGAGFEPATPAV